MQYVILTFTQMINKNVTLWVLRTLWKQAMLTPLLFNFSVQYVTIKVKEKWPGLKLEGRHQLLLYAGDNLLGGNTDTTKKGGGDFICC